MKLIKIDGYWTIISDKEIKNCLVYYPKENKFSEIKGFLDLTSVKEEWAYKVLYSQNPKHNLSSITFSDEVAKELAIVDVERLVDKLFKDEFKLAQESMPAIWYDIKLKAIKLYNQALSDNKEKMFTLEDIRSAFNAGRSSQVSETYSDKKLHPNIKYLSDDNYIQSLTKQEWECELEMSVVHTDHAPGGFEYFPTITNNSVKVIRIWK